MESQIFRALGDPVRLAIVTRLSDWSVSTLTGMTEGLGISRQAVRKQVQVLVSAKVLRLRHEGREVRIMLDVNALRQGKIFIEKLEDAWDRRLSWLKNFVENQKS